MEYNLPCLTATQFNREGFDNSDPSLTNTSESFGLPQTADLQLALVTSEELERDGLLMVKQLKNRYADTTKYRRFTIKIDRSKMRLSNDPQQQYLSDPIPTNQPKMGMNAPKMGRGGGSRGAVTFSPQLPVKNLRPADSDREKFKITF